MEDVGVASAGGAGVLVAAGLASAFATCAAHELLHRPGAWDQWAARTIMAICCYGHFVVEHLHHHASAGHVDAGTVPKLGEGMYAFILRNARFSFGNAYTVAEAMRRRRSLGWTGNRVLRQHALAECRDVAEFVEGNRLGGPARAWFEAAYPDRRWHVAVGSEYDHELHEALERYARTEGGAVADAELPLLSLIRSRAGEYIAALDEGEGRGLVGLGAFEEQATSG